jgi:uncharacterized protein (TIGR00730 family)
MTRLRVGVFCSASREIPGHYVELAAQVGAGIAQRGWDLVSGGEHVSMMGAVAAAARAGGAHTLGVVTRRLLGKADLESDELVVTESIGERKARMVASAHVLLVLPGGIGTCEELFEAWTGRILGVHAKPIVILDVYGYFSGLLSWLGGVGERGFASRSALDVVIRVSNVAQALDACAGAGLLPDPPLSGPPLSGRLVTGIPVTGMPVTSAVGSGTLA